MKWITARYLGHGELVVISALALFFSRWLDSMTGYNASYRLFNFLVLPSQLVPSNEVVMISLYYLSILSLLMKSFLSKWNSTD